MKQGVLQDDPKAIAAFLKAFVCVDKLCVWGRECFVLVTPCTPCAPLVCRRPTTDRTSVLSKTRVGEYLGQLGSGDARQYHSVCSLHWLFPCFNPHLLLSCTLLQALLKEYMELFVFRDMSVDVALRYGDCGPRLPILQLSSCWVGFVCRLWLTELRPPGEAQIFDRLLTQFAAAYCRDNPTVRTDALPHLWSFVTFGLFCRRSAILMPPTSFRLH